MNNKVTINAILNVIRTTLSIIFPLITYPYAARVLGTDGIGMVSYVTSIINYFVLIASFGISGYATREGAKIRGNRSAFQSFFEEMNAINVGCMIMAYAGLALMMLVMKPRQEYMVLFVILGSQIFFKTFSYEWVNTVYEDFTYITVRSIITNIVSLILLFIIVRQSKDVYLYAAITAITYGINCGMNLWYCRKYIKLRVIRKPKWRNHITSLLYFFANEVAISVYVNIDTTMLGYYRGDSAVGIYTIAVKIYAVIKRILAAIYAVTVPQLAEFAGRGESSRFKELYTKICAVVLVLLIPAAMGLFTLSEELIYFMGGEKYKDGILSLQILSIGLIFAIFGGLVTACFNIVQKKEKINFYATLVGAGLNIVLNFIFIPLFGQYGAAFTTTISEGAVFLIAFLKIRDKEKYLDMRFLLIEMRNAVIGSLFIYFSSLMVHHLVINRMISFMVILVGSVVVYLIWLRIIRDKLLMEALARKRSFKY